MWLPLALSEWVLWATLGLPIIVIVAILTSTDEGDDPLVFANITWIGFLIYLIGFTPYGAKTTIPMLIWGAVGYILVGVLWSFKKWYSYVVTTLKKYQDYKYNQKQLSERQPAAKDNKLMITTWMATWPFSMAWWVLTWPRKVFTLAYDLLSTLYDRISAAIWQKALDALQK